MLTPLTTATAAQTIAEAEKAVIIFVKKLCAHCKNMEKVLEKFAVQHHDVLLFCIDSEDEPALMAEYNAERTPTIVVIKSGKVVASKAGLMNPREMAAFYAAAQ